ncbi:PREDICTED: low-density lipoprotein receptor-related protein 4-like [Priapulus caudatus]|uniref:Low-density lipoprotein receptor-related protein 4-like n=1 Tax=Priapulus caudatus TaxID=37621 RepID=A0ABM1E5E1_PRICU|nr:PREDICTED: low-density lipoprotein receptor-related protein 4-like [Priapulus caudatus]
MDALSRLAFALLICVATVACVAAQATPAVTRCNVDDFVCDSGVCIWLEWRCDGLDDCGDDSDEQNCDTPDRKCRPTSERRCPDGMCVLKKEPCTCLADQQRCDNGNCVAMSDRCPGACRPDERMCPNVTCVAAGALCPGECADFRCDDGTCLDAAFICDSVADCADAADERNCTADRECTREQFACADGGNATCIRAAWRSIVR